MAHTKAAGSAKRTVDVAGKRLGIKKFAGEYVKPGNIVVRQHGTHFHAGVNTMLGRDYTIFATVEGFVSFRQMTGYKRAKKYVDVMPTKESIAPNARKTSGTKAVDDRMRKGATPTSTAKAAAAATAKAEKAEAVEPKAAVKKTAAKKPAKKAAAKK